MSDPTTELSNSTHLMHSPWIVEKWKAAHTVALKVTRELE